MFNFLKPKQKLLNTKVKEYFSHYGEDVILQYLFKNQDKGTYIDIGCYHPTLFSNTKKLYDRGWHGINIDANVETIKLFNESRPQDINLNTAIAKNVGTAEYFEFLDIDTAGGGSGNSLSTEVRDHYEKQGLKTKTKQIATETLANINKKYLNNRKIDFLNIDVEGFDLEVLESNDWQAFRPRFIAVEIWTKNIDFDNTTENEIYNFLRGKGYKAFSVAIHTWFFYDLEDKTIDLS